jgi:hypothetical protein
MKTFPCSLDKLASIIPYLLIGLVLVISIPVYFSLKQAHAARWEYVLEIAPAAFILLSLDISMYLLKPLSVNVAADAIVVDRKIKPVQISFTDIKEIRLVEPSDMRMSIRTFGNGGVFGYTGLYYNRKMGSMRWYCTQRKNYVLIATTKGKKMIVTPDEPGAFMNELESIRALKDAIEAGRAAS